MPFRGHLRRTPVTLGQGTGGGRGLGYRQGTGIRSQTEEVTLAAPSPVVAGPPGILNVSRSHSRSGSLLAPWPKNNCPLSTVPALSRQPEK